MYRESTQECKGINWKPENVKIFGEAPIVGFICVYEKGKNKSKDKHKNKDLTIIKMMVTTMIRMTQLIYYIWRSYTSYGHKGWY